MNELQLGMFGAEDHASSWTQCTIWGTKDMTPKINDEAIPLASMSTLYQGRW